MACGAQLNEDAETNILSFQNGNWADTSSCDEDENRKETALPNDPELARINQDKALLSLGLYRYRIPTDGNCLFRAVASQLKLDQERYHPVLRKAAVKWMQANAEELIVGGMLDNLEEIDAASELGAWAGQAAIIALANIFSINIAVVQGGDKGDIDIQHISPFETPMDGEEQGSVILAYMYNGHFDAVVDQDDLPNPDYEAWQYEQVHGSKPTEMMGGEANVEIPKQLSDQEVFVPSVEKHQPENIRLSYIEDDDSELTANIAQAEQKVMDQTNVPESHAQSLVENSEGNMCSEKDASAASSFVNDDNSTQTDRTWREIRLDGAARPTKQLSQEDLDCQKQSHEDVESQKEQDKAEAASANEPLQDDTDETDRWASFFKNVSQELQSDDTRSPPPPLNMRLEDIPEETQSQLATPMLTPLATPHEMENPWANFTQTIERDSSFDDNNSNSNTLTDDDNSDSNDSVVKMDLENENNEADKSESTMSENITFIEKNTGEENDNEVVMEDESLQKIIPNGDAVSPENVNKISEDGKHFNPGEETMETNATNLYGQNSLESDISLASQTSSMSIAIATDDTASVSADPRPTLHMQRSQDSLAGISPWSSFSQSLDKEAQQEADSPAITSPAPATTAPLLQKIPDGNALHIVALGDGANFNTSQVPDKSVTNVAPIPQKFKTIRDLPKQWEDVKKERSSLERDPITVVENNKAKNASCQQTKNIPNHDPVSNAKSVEIKGEACDAKIPTVEVTNRDKHDVSNAQKNVASDKKFVSSTKWENSTKADSSGKKSGQLIASINISNILAPEDCVKCEHVVKPRIRVIPVQFCGKRGATLKNMRSSDVETGLSISTGGGEVNIPIQSNKQRIKAEIIEERGSVDINGHKTETVERKGTYTTLPDEKPSEPKIDLIEHKPPVLTPLSGSKITITDNPNVASPVPIIKPKKRVPVRVIHENDPSAGAVSFESQVSQESFDQSPRVRNIPVIVTNEERKARSRSKSQVSPPTPSSYSFAAPAYNENVRSNVQQARCASSDSHTDKRKVSSSSTSTGYQSQTSTSSSSDNHDNNQEFPEVFSKQRSAEAAKVWDETARNIGDEAERVKQRIEAARSAFGGNQPQGASGGDSSGERNVNISFEGRSSKTSDDSERGYSAYGAGRHAWRDQARGSKPRGPYRGDSTDSSYSSRGAYSHPGSEGTYRSEPSWSSQSSTEDRQYPYRQRTRANRYGEEPTYCSRGDRSNIRIGAEASRFRNEEEINRRRNESLGGSIQIEVTHEQSDPFRERLRRMTAGDKPASYFDLKEDPVTVRNLLRPLNLSFVNSLLNTEIDSFFGRDDFFSDF